MQPSCFVWLDGAFIPWDTALTSFFTGTILEIRAVHVLGAIKFSYEKSGAITKKIHDAFKNIITGNDSRFSDWLTRV